MGMIDHIAAASMNNKPAEQPSGGGGRRVRRESFTKIISKPPPGGRSHAADRANTMGTAGMQSAASSVAASDGGSMSSAPPRIGGSYSFSTPPQAGSVTGGATNSANRGRRNGDKAARLLGCPDGACSNEVASISSTHSPAPAQGQLRSSGSGSGQGQVRRVSFLKSQKNDKTARRGGGGVGLPTASETSECSIHSTGSGGGSAIGSSINGAVRRTRFHGGSTNTSSFGSSSEDVFEGSLSGSLTGQKKGKKKKGFKKTGRTVRSLMRSLRRPAGDDGSECDVSVYSNADSVSASATSASIGERRGTMKKTLSKKWEPKSIGSGPPRKAVSFPMEDSIASIDENGDFVKERGETRRSMTARRDNLDAKSITMGLDPESADFLDFMDQEKCKDWLKSLKMRDPRACIKLFFDDLARDGADHIEKPNGFQPELLSPLLSMFQRSSVFSVWRPTSIDSIRKMMTGQGTGKGLDIKGKSAKKGKLSAYVPFLQIHEEEHMTKIRLLPPEGRIRVFYKKREARDNAQEILANVLKEMTEAADGALRGLLESDKMIGEDLVQDGPSSGPVFVQRVLSFFRSVDLKGSLTADEQENINTVEVWFMNDPDITVIDDYSPKCYGIDMPKRLFWEGYVMRAKDISRPPGSVYDTGRPSRASFQDMNFASIKNSREECPDDMPRAVVWQYTDPYLPPTEPDPDPMMPQTLLMAYEEHGRVMPVVSDFDCFLLGTRGVRFHTPLPADQVELVHNMLGDIENILNDNKEGKSNNWTSSWLNTMKHHKKHITMPKYGFGDPKSYAIMRHAVKRLEEFGAVRHGAECFNFYFPQELDDEFLVIGGNLGGKKYKYMKLNELQDFLLGCIDLGFTFPLNPKWTLCDAGWRTIWDKLTGSTHPNVQLSINAWYPPGSGLKERIEQISKVHPRGFDSDLSGRKKGTQAWDEAEIALDRYQRIQRAKRKLWAVLCWIGIVQLSRKRVLQARKEEEAKEQGKELEVKFEKEGEEVEVEVTKDKEGKVEVEVIKDKEGKVEVEVTKNKEGKVEVEVDQESAEKRVSFQDPSEAKVSMFPVPLIGSKSSVSSTPDEIRMMGDVNALGRSRSRTEGEGRSASARMDAYGRRTSSSFSNDEENIDVIDSVLSKSVTLSEFEISGLQRIRKQMVDHSGSSQRRVNNRVERRHTSIDGRLSGMMLEDAPSFILKEYGGVKGESKVDFKTQVKKIIHAQRLMASARECVAEPRTGDNGFLPVEWTSLSKETKHILMEKLSFDALKRWDYNILDLAQLCNGSPLLFIGWAVLGSPHAQEAMAYDLVTKPLGKCGYNFINSLNLQMPILCSFLRTVEADYLLNPYHNNTHAADVVQTLNTMLQLGGKDYASSPLDIFSILVAAVIHDVKHPGLNNNFQINSRSDLAVQYNDVSVLENYSLTWLFSKLLGQTRDFTVDIFSGLSKEQFSKARSIIIRAVLETDMTHHFDLLKKMGIHQVMLKGKHVDEWLHTYTNEGVNYDPSMDMLCFLLHQADISNPAKPFPLFAEWADRILAESYEQGDKEASLSLAVSPLCDRVTTDKKQSQIGFIKFVVRPSYQLLGEIIPLFAETVFPHIEKSLQFWDKYEEGSETC